MNPDEPIPDLTEEGRRWAKQNCWTSMCANVALQAHQYNTNWPENFRRAAVITANEEGASSK